MGQFGILLRLNYNIGFLAIGLMFLSGCSSTRHVPEGEYLLRRTSVEIETLPRKERRELRKADEPVRSRRENIALRNDLTPLQRQDPNSRFALIPMRLMMYNSVNPEKDNRWVRFMQRAGEPPVVFDSAFADQTVRQMQQYLINTGHFHSEVYYVCNPLRRSQRMGLVFHVNPGHGYRYRNVSLDIRDDSLAHLLNDWHNRTLIRSGDPYNVEILEAERSRVVRRIQNMGFYFFSRDNIEFLIDSALNSYEMDITMIVKPPEIGGHNQQYTFGDVFIFSNERASRAEQRSLDTTTFRIPKSRTDTTVLNYHFIHSQPLQIKPSVITSKLAIQQGSPFSLTSVDRTYENLLDLRVFRSTNITIAPLPVDTNNPQFLLNTTIEVQQAPVNMWAVELEGTSTDNLFGTIINTSFQNRNLFGGAEIFSLRLRGLVEMQYLLDPAAREAAGGQFIDNFDIGISANLDFPRFVAPFHIRQTTVHRPRTTISAGYNYRFRFNFYDRQLINLSFGYSWRQPRVLQTLFPLDISMIDISLKPDFQARIDTLPSRRLQYQYENHFIFAMRYAFSFSGQQGIRPISFNAFRFSIESSGNSLYMLSNLLDAQKNEKDQYQFLHLGYAQFIRTDADFRRYWYLTNTQILVTRLMGGIGIAYGNSMTMPYEKGFFAGGNNNIRAWPMSQLGPGSFFDSEMPNIEHIGDIVLVGNIEYRFPISGAFKGALFVDAGNIWLRNDDDGSFPGGEFAWKNVPNDLAIGGGFGLRWDLNFLVIRLDAATPLRNPARPSGEKWVVRHTRMRDFVLNFGIGYPF